MSQYDPEGILSGSMLSIRTALNALHNNPQNNFRIMVDGKNIYDDEAKITHDINGKSVLDIFFHENSAISVKIDDIIEDKIDSEKITDHGSGLESILNILTSILKAENILSKISRMQFFDLIDVEGQYPFLFLFCLTH